MKKFLFFALAPIYFPLALFMGKPFELWQELADGHQIIFLLLGTIFVPIALFMIGTYEWWEKLLQTA